MGRAVVPIFLERFPVGVSRIFDLEVGRTGSYVLGIASRSFRQQTREIVTVRRVFTHIHRSGTPLA